MDAYVAVVGAGVADADLEAQAEEVGRLLADAGARLLTGGLGGVMQASCRGARSRGGVTIALLPSLDRRDANEHVQIALPTGMGEMRNALIVRAADAVIAIDGEYGTLSEVAFALKTNTPVVGLGTWELVKDGRAIDAVARASSPAEAVDLALRACRR